MNLSELVANTTYVHEDYPDLVYRRVNKVLCSKVKFTDESEYGKIDTDTAYGDGFSAWVEEGPNDEDFDLEEDRVIPSDITRRDKLAITVFKEIFLVDGTYTEGGIVSAVEIADSFIEELDK